VPVRPPRPLPEGRVAGRVARRRNLDGVTPGRVPPSTAYRALFVVPRGHGARRGCAPPRVVSVAVDGRSDPSPEAVRGRTPRRSQFGPYPPVSPFRRGPALPGARGSRPRPVADSRTGFAATRPPSGGREAAVSRGRGRVRPAPRLPHGRRAPGGDGVRPVRAQLGGVGAGLGGVVATLAGYRVGVGLAALGVLVGAVVAWSSRG
jgi:hypothetical protein